MARKNEVLRLALLTSECASRHRFKPQEKPRQLSGLSGAEEGRLEDLQDAAILLVDARRARSRRCASVHSGRVDLRRALGEWRMYMRAFHLPNHTCDSLGRLLAPPSFRFVPVARKKPLLAGQRERRRGLYPQRPLSLLREIAPLQREGPRIRAHRIGEDCRATGVVLTVCGGLSNRSTSLCP
jgi:hypothetical protein